MIKIEFISESTNTLFSFLRTLPLSKGRPCVTENITLTSGIRKDRILPNRVSWKMALQHRVSWKWPYNTGCPENGPTTQGVLKNSLQQRVSWKRPYNTGCPKKWPTTQGVLKNGSSTQGVLQKIWPYSLLQKLLEYRKDAKTSGLIIYFTKKIKFRFEHILLCKKRQAKDISILKEILNFI